MKAFILLSGGMDSATLLASAIKDFGKENVTAVSIDYGQLHKLRELEMASKLADHFKVHRLEYNIQDSIGKGGLTDSNMEIPDVGYDELTGVSPTYVPFRNGLLLSTVTSLAAGSIEGTGEDAVVGYGAHAEDAENWAYPDCTPEFIGAMAAAIYIGSYHKIRLYTPLMWLKKSAVVTLGADLDVPFELTWSCYRGLERHCGTCPTCRARKTAFEDAYMPDPTEYAT